MPEQTVGDVADKTGSLPTEKTPGDAVHAVVKAVASAVPIIGGPAAELIALITPPLERRRTAWLDDLAVRLKRLEAEKKLRVEDLGDNPAFIDAILSATSAATRTADDEKRTALRNAVLNVATNWDPDESLGQAFLGLVERFQPWHLRLLKAMDDPPRWAKAHGARYEPGFSSSLSGFIEAAFPELRGGQDFYGQLWAEIGQEGLTNTTGLSGMMTETGWQASRTSDRGKSFLRFVSEPQ